MRILIIGVTGMLGSALHRVFAPDNRFETWGTLRAAAMKRHFDKRHHERLVTGVEVSDLDGLVGTLGHVQPDVVINAVGVIKQLASAHDPLVVLPINSIFPHRLSRLCELAGARLVHVSTDCVFTGKRGAYREDDMSDAEDLYGKSKFLGEITSAEHAITLRTSGIGHELNSQHGLLEWFLSTEGSARGFSKAIYSGLPWVELAHVIRDRVLPRPDLHGLYHVSSEPINKLALLHLFAEAYGKSVNIIPDDSVAIDRSLDSTRFRAATGYVSAPWPDLIALMHSHRPSPAANAR